MVNIKTKNDCSYVQILLFLGIGVFIGILIDYNFNPSCKEVYFDNCDCYVYDDILNSAYAEIENLRSMLICKDDEGVVVNGDICSMMIECNIERDELKQKLKEYQFYEGKECYCKVIK